MTFAGEKSEAFNAALGARLRTLRESWGLTLREVERRTEALAADMRDPDFEVSASLLSRIEGGAVGVSATKLIALTSVFALSPEQIAALLSTAVQPGTALSSVQLPNSTLLLDPHGPLHMQSELMLPSDVLSSEPPDDTALLTRPSDYPKQFRRAIVGKKDRFLDPMIKPGSIAVINTERKEIRSRREWTNEFDRPIYLLISRDGYHISFCELDKNDRWLTLVPHALSYQANKRYRYKDEIEVIGEVTAFTTRRSD